MVANSGSPVFLAITNPFHYYSRLSYTKTRSEILKVRAYAKVYEGSISRVYYSLDNGNRVNMNRIGSSDNYEADLDARLLQGEHLILVTADHSYGTWAANRQEIRVFFDNTVPEKTAPQGCQTVTSIPSQEPIITTSLSPTLILSPTVTPPISISPSPPNINNCPLQYSYEQGFNRKSLNNVYKYFTSFTLSSAGYVSKINVRAGNWGGAWRSIICKITNEVNQEMFTEKVSVPFRNDGADWRTIDLKSESVLLPSGNYRLHCRGTDSFNSIYWLADQTNKFNYRIFFCPAN